MARRPAIPLLAALVCLLALALTGVLALTAPGVHERDAAMLHGFTALDRPRVHGVIAALASLADPLPYGIAGLALAGAALRRSGRLRAAVVAVVLVASGACTQLVKLLLVHPRFVEWLGADQIADAAWPSGHATAAMALALCAVLVAPPAWRATVAVAGGGFAAAVGYAVIVLAWHFPSDVLGGFLMAALWTALAVAVLRAAGEGSTERHSAVAWAPQLRLWLFAGIAALVAAAVLASPDGVALYAAERPTLVVGVGVIAALAAALAAAVARQA